MSETKHHLQPHHIFINAEGFAFAEDLPLEESLALKVFENLHLNKSKHTLWTKVKNKECLVIAFDKPFIAKDVSVQSEVLNLVMPYGFQAEASLNELYLDHWDRICGITKQKIPFILSRKSQVSFFDLLDTFEDDSVTLNGKKYDTPSWKKQSSDDPKFWTKFYENNHTPWNLGKPHPYLSSEFHGMKALRSQILVLGSGYGHDAAYLASKGHFVTALEKEELAHTEAVKKYGHLNDLKLIQGDALEYPFQSNNFDIIFEHGFFCALPEEQLDEVVKLWKRCLRSQGLLLGAFLLGHYRGGPPFVTTQWELHRRLEPELRRMYIRRWPSDEKNMEYIVCFQKK